MNLTEYLDLSKKRQLLPVFAGGEVPMILDHAPAICAQVAEGLF